MTFNFSLWSLRPEFEPPKLRMTFVQFVFHMRKILITIGIWYSAIYNFVSFSRMPNDKQYSAAKAAELIFGDSDSQHSSMSGYSADDSEASLDDSQHYVADVIQHSQVQNVPYDPHMDIVQQDIQNGPNVERMDTSQSGRPEHIDAGLQCSMETIASQSHNASAEDTLQYDPEGNAHGSQTESAKRTAACAAFDFSTDDESIVPPSPMRPARKLRRGAPAPPPSRQLILQSPLVSPVAGTLRYRGLKRTSTPRELVLDSDLSDNSQLDLSDSSQNEFVPDSEQSQGSEVQFDSLPSDLEEDWNDEWDRDDRDDRDNGDRHFNSDGGEQSEHDDDDVDVDGDNVNPEDPIREMPRTILNYEGDEHRTADDAYWRSPIHYPEDADFPELPEFIEPGGTVTFPTDGLKPVDYLKHVFPPSLFTFIAGETNRYAAANAPNRRKRHRK